MFLIWMTPILPHFLVISSSTITVQAINRDLEEENIRFALGNTGETARENWGNRLKIGACGTLTDSPASEQAVLRNFLSFS
jgi:hypothetical protein